MTTSIAREHQRTAEEEDPFKRIKRQSDLEMLNESLDLAENGKKGGSIFKFWRANKWRKYIDRVLGSEDDML